MRVFYWVGVGALRAGIVGAGIVGIGIGCIPVLAQTPLEPHNTPQDAPQNPAASTVTPNPESNPEQSPVVLDWTPPALAQLKAQAAVKSSFKLDRTMLAAAASLMPDSEAQTRQAIDKLDGVSVHLLRFGPAGIADEASVDAIRDAYHLRGWKHLVTTTDAGTNGKSALRSGTTDLWLVMDGVNVRGAVVLVETPKSLTLLTLAGNLSPVDILHLRGHFGIPRFDGDSFKDAKNR